MLNRSSSIVKCLLVWECSTDLYIYYIACIKKRKSVMIVYDLV